MDSLFISVLNMSFTGSLLIMLVLIARLPLKKAPKIYSYLLWFVPMFRLVFPFSIESAYSLIPINPEFIPYYITSMDIPRINTNVAFINNIINPVLQSEPFLKNSDTLNFIITLMCVIWAVGLISIFIYALHSNNKLEHTLLTCFVRGERTYSCDNIKIPFVKGIFKPEIYLPESLNKAEREYIISHEKIHIRRLDYLVKFISFIALMLHWFNPLVWLACTLMEKDMEMSCDEAVISGSDDNIRQAYSQSLLNISIDGGTPFMPLSFAEGNIKNRIKNILSFKKLPFPGAIAMTVIVITFSILCAFRPIPNPEPLRDNIKLSVNAEPTLIVSHNQTNDIVKITDSSLNNWIDSLNIREINSYLHIECEYKCHFALYTPQRNYYLYNGPQGYSDYPEYLLQVQTENNFKNYSISEENFNGMYACYQSAKKKPVKYNHYSYKGDDPLLQLAYTAEMSSSPDEGIKVSSMVIHDYSIEENKLKIFATVFNRNYKICGNQVITSYSEYLFKAYTFTSDKSLLSNNSIDVKAFSNHTTQTQQINMYSERTETSSLIYKLCTTPVSNTPIPDLYTKFVLNKRDTYNNLRQANLDNLTETLDDNNLKNMYLAYLQDINGEKLN